MCYRNCSFEDFHGECRRKPQDLCPDSFETDQEYWDAVNSLYDEFEQMQDQEQKEVMPLDKITLLRLMIATMFLYTPMALDRGLDIL